MTENLKNFYQIAFDASEITEKQFNRPIDIGDFDIFLADIYKLSDVEIERTKELMRETIAWKDYFADIKATINMYKDRFLIVDECYESLMATIKNEKVIPKAMLATCKIKADNVSDIISEVTSKDVAIKGKLNTLKIFSKYLDSYIHFLNNMYFKLNGIINGYGSRYWNIYD